MLQVYANCVVIIVLAVMAVQDFRYRGISWYNFVMLGAFLFLAKGSLDTVEITFNLIFITATFLLMTAWFSFRESKWINLLTCHIGLGDYLFLLCLALYLPFITFFSFFLFSVTLIAVVFGLYLWLFKPKGLTVPLAGLQSLLLLLLMATCWANGLEIYELELVKFYPL